MAAAKNISALLLSVIVIGLLAVGGYVTFQDMSGPEVTLSPATDRVSPKLDMVLDLKDAKSGIRAVTVTVKKNSNTYVVFEEHFPDVQFHQRVTFNLKDAGLREGAFELEIKASDASLAGFGKGNTTTRRMEMRMDSLPPRISVKTMPPYVRRGGVGTIAYTVSEDVRTSGVKVGDLFFPGFRQPNGDYYCFFAFPHFLTVQQYAPDIMAEDMAGNVTSSRLAFRPIDKQFRHDNIPLSDNFLNSKMPDFQADFPDATSMLDLFLKVNSVMRKSNEEKLLEVGRNTASSMLWKGEFLRLPNSANRAGFADHRSYIYGGRVVDEQTHLGLDLASLAMAPIPAANSGRLCGQSGHLRPVGHRRPRPRPHVALLAHERDCRERRHRSQKGGHPWPHRDDRHGRRRPSPLRHAGFGSAGAAHRVARFALDQGQCHRQARAQSPIACL